MRIHFIKHGELRGWVWVATRRVPYPSSWALLEGRKRHHTLVNLRFSLTGIQHRNWGCSDCISPLQRRFHWKWCHGMDWEDRLVAFSSMLRRVPFAWRTLFNHSRLTKIYASIKIVSTSLCWRFTFCVSFSKVLKAKILSWRLLVPSN